MRRILWLLLIAALCLSSAGAEEAPPWSAAGPTVPSSGRVNGWEMQRYSPTRVTQTNRTQTAAMADRTQPRYVSLRCPPAS